ncbi:MAG: ubiquinol-cytochrome chaperone family protein [Micavibrio sp.]|nr:ubiquinol-cytochrome chaperone family protein [Micavibrio sp.]
MLTFFRSKSNPDKIAAEKLYFGLVAQARNPVFYAGWQVPDTLDGRFDMVLLHVFAVIQHLRKHGKEGSKRAQALYDVMFVDMDRSVREMGIGDLGVKRHIRRMMTAFNGRMDAYAKGIEDPSMLEGAIRRNVYAQVDGNIDTAPLKAYLLCCVQGEQAVMSGQMIWPVLGEMKQSA